MLNEETARETDHNGYITIRDNPITRAGVFQYKGSQLPGGDANKIYNVYRPLEELQKDETLKSMQGLPIIDEHEMLGDRYARSPEQRGTHGSTLEAVRLVGNDVLANLRIWSRTLKSLIDAGKKGLSLGYNCMFEKSSGVYEGIAYDYIQRNIRGNHLALVNQGRSGTAVLDQHDALDHFDLAIDTKEFDNMADADNKDDKDKKTETAKDGDGEKKEMTLSEVSAVLSEIMPIIAKMNETLTASKADPEDGVMDADTKEKSGDQAKDKDDMKACDKDEKDDKKEAMDAADVERLVEQRIRAHNKGGMKAIMNQVSARDALVKEVTPLTGTFDASAMDADDVAVYAAEKLGIKVTKGQELAALNGYLAGAKKAGESKIGFAMDSIAIKAKSGGKLAATLKTTH